MREPRLLLEDILRSIGPAGIAVSGGIDSLTLATIAHDTLGAIEMFHAVSPAVPPDATARTRALAAARGWTLSVIDAGEFDDPAYRANPVNRCFYCKSNLYDGIARQTRMQILSGTNLDDLGEYRPGLVAAQARGVRHPFVEAGIDKAGVRRLAAAAGLGQLADLPSSPCLSSRIETGIAIEGATLAMIDAAEKMVRATLRPETVRCRLRSAGFVVELDGAALARLDVAGEAALRREITGLARAARLPHGVSFAAYRNGSAFLTQGHVS